MPPHNGFMLLTVLSMDSTLVDAIRKINIDRATPIRKICSHDFLKLERLINSFIIKG
jgi:hypothetical protein